MITAQLHPSIKNFLLNFIYQDETKFIEIGRYEYDFYGLIPKIRKNTLKNDSCTSTLTFGRWCVEWGDRQSQEYDFEAKEKESRERITKLLKMFGY